MTIVSTETLSQIAQCVTASAIEQATANAQRLDDWKRRYPRDLVDVPAPTEEQKWPIIRSISDKAEHLLVFQLKAKR